MRLASTLLCLALTAATPACTSDPWLDPARGDAFVPEPVRARRLGTLFEDASPGIRRAAGGAGIVSGERAGYAVHDVVLGRGGAATDGVSAIAWTRTADWAGSDGVTLEAVAAGPVLAFSPALDPKRDPTLYPGPDVAYVAQDDRVARVTRADGEWRFDALLPPDSAEPTAWMADATAGAPHVFALRHGDARNRVVLVRPGPDDAPASFLYRTAAGAWSPAAGDAEPLFRAGPGGVSVSRNAYLGGVLAVYAWTVPSSGAQGPRLRVLARSARSPEGPWSAETLLVETAAGGGPGTVPVAREQPHLARDAGRVVFVTIDDGAGEGAPQMWRVEFPELR